MAKSPRPGHPPDQRKRQSSGKDADLLTLGRRVCELREAAGLTQEALAHAAGLHWTYVGQVERGERNLSYRSLLKLARGLDIAPSELVPSEILPGRR